MTKPPAAELSRLMQDDPNLARVLEANRPFVTVHGFLDDEPRIHYTGDREIAGGPKSLTLLESGTHEAAAFFLAGHPDFEDWRERLERQRANPKLAYNHPHIVFTGQAINAHFAAASTGIPMDIPAAMIDYAFVNLVRNDYGLEFPYITGSCIIYSPELNKVALQLRRNTHLGNDLLSIWGGGYCPFNVTERGILMAADKASIFNTIKREFTEETSNYVSISLRNIRNSPLLVSCEHKVVNYQRNEEGRLIADSDRLTGSLQFDAIGVPVDPEEMLWMEENQHKAEVNINFEGEFRVFDIDDLRARMTEGSVQIMPRGQTSLAVFFALLDAGILPRHHNPVGTSSPAGSPETNLQDSDAKACTGLTYTFTNPPASGEDVGKVLKDRERIQLTANTGTRSRAICEDSGKKKFVSWAVMQIILTKEAYHLKHGSPLSLGIHGRCTIPSERSVFWKFAGSRVANVVEAQLDSLLLGVILKHMNYNYTCSPFLLKSFTEALLREGYEDDALDLQSLFEQELRSKFKPHDLPMMIQSSSNVIYRDNNVLQYLEGYAGAGNVNSYCTLPAHLQITTRNSPLTDDKLAELLTKTVNVLVSVLDRVRPGATRALCP